MDARDEIEALLPGYAAGQLAADETERVERALRADPALVEELRFVEALAGGVRRVDATPTPGEIGRQRLRRNLAAAAPVRRGFEWWPRIALAALLVVALQGVLLWRVMTPPDGPYAPLGSDVPGLLQVRFAPAASAAAIERLLQSERLEVVSGPGAAGVYRLRPSGDPQGRDLAALVAHLRARPAIIAFAARQ